MNLARKILYGAGAVAGLLIVVALLLPSTGHVEREIDVDAHAATVFALVNDFEQINKWSTWMEMDPNARYELSGPQRGVGATIRWDGAIMGSGGQTIVVSEPFEKVVGELNFGDDGKSFNTFVLSPNADGGTTVVWSFDMEFGFNLFGRYFGLMLDNIIGPDHESGLEALKTMAESLPKGDFSDIDIELIVVEEVEIAYLSVASQPEAAAIAEAMGDAYFRILNFIDRNNLREAGAPISVSRGFIASRIRFDAGIPVNGVSESTPNASDGVQLGKTYAGPVVRVKHVGSYRKLAQTHEKIAAYMAALGMQRNGDAWESYVSDPTRVDEADLLTYVYYPIRER